jgi:hypothetical protein
MAGAGSNLVFMWNRDTPEVAEAKRARVARSRRIQSGAMAGLLERDGKTIRPEVRTLIDEELSKRRYSPVNTREAPTPGETTAPRIL